MSSVDERIVRLRFDNAEFARGIQSTMAQLEQLRKATDVRNLGAGLNDLNRAASGFNLNPIGTAVDSIISKFRLLDTIVHTTMATLTYEAIQFGQRFASSFTIDPLKDGLHEYETNMNSIQTILANTQAAGTNLKDVTKALDELNRYSDQTIYNFSEMAKNIGTFTAAGVGLERATESIKGIANLAALSGSNSEQASTAMYQLSQAIAAGKVTLMDWNSVVNAGLGGSVFQRALANTAVAMGTLNKNAVQLKGEMKNVTINGEAFRNSLTPKPGEQGWLTSDVLTSTLAQFTGDLSDAELAAMGFNRAQIQAIQAQADTAQKAATQVKTLTQLIGTAKEAMGTGWADTWRLVFGDFDEARNAFTGANNIIGAFIAKQAKSRNDMLKIWKDLGGRDVLIDTLRQSLVAIVSIIRPVKEAFREFFPAKTGKDIYNLTVLLHDFVQGLILTNGQASKLKNGATVLFAALSIGKTILVELVKFVGRLFGTITGSNALEDGASNAADFATNLQKILVVGGGIERFFGRLFDVVTGVWSVAAAGVKLFLGVLVALAVRLESFWQDNIVSSEEFQTSFAKMAEKLKHPMDIVAAVVDHLAESLKNFNFSNVTDWIAGLGNGSVLAGKLLDGLGYALDFVVTVANKLVDVFTGGLSEGFGRLNWDYILHFIKGITNAGFLAALTYIGVQLYYWLRRFAGLAVLLNNVNDTFEQLTSTLKSMQHTLSAATLLLIAVAVGILAASLIALSRVDPSKMAVALGGLTALFTQLVGSFAILKTLSIGPLGGYGLVSMATGMVIMAGAVRILAGAVVEMSSVNWDEMRRGLTGVVTLLGALSVAGVVLSKNSGGLITAGTGMILFAVAIKIISKAVQGFASYDWESIAKGLAAVGAVMAAMTVFSTLSTLTVGAGASMVLMSVGLFLIAGAVKRMGNLDFEQIIKGLAGMAGVMAVIGAFTLLGGAAKGIAASGLAILLIAVGMERIGNLKWEEIAKAMVGLAGGLGIMAGALILLSKSPGAAGSVLVLSLALNALTNAMSNIGDMTWSEIIKALVGLAGGLGILGATLTFMTATIPGSLALVIASAALGSLAAAMGKMGGMSWDQIAKSLVVLGAGLLELAAGLLVMEATIPGAAALAINATALLLLANALRIMGDMSWSEIVKSLVLLAGALTVLGVAGLLITPAILPLKLLAIAIGLLGLGVIAAGVGMLAMAHSLAVLGQYGEKGFAVLIKGIKDFVQILPEIGTKTAQMIVEFIAQLGAGAGKMTAAMTAIGHGMLDTMVELIPAFAVAGVQIVNGILLALANGFPAMAATGTRLMLLFLNAIADAIPDVIQSSTDIIVNFLLGIANNQGRIIDAGVLVLIGFLAGVGSNSALIVDQAGQTILDFLLALEAASAKYSRQYTDIGINIGVNIAKGVVQGLGDAAGNVFSAGADLGKSAIGGMTSWLDIHSPSRVARKDVGQNVGLGVAKGIQDSIPLVVDQAKRLGQAAINESQAVVDGLKSIGNTLQATFQGIFSNGKKTISKLFGNTDASAAGADAAASAKKAADDASYSWDKLTKSLDLGSTAQKKSAAATTGTTAALDNQTAALDKAIKVKPTTKAKTVAIGKAMAEGVAQGIIDNIPLVEKATERIDEVLDATPKSTKLADVFHEAIGTVKDLKAALTGTASDISGAYNKSLEGLQKTQTDTGNNIVALKNKLLDLLTAKEQDKAAIAATTAELKNASNEYLKVSDAIDYLNGKGSVHEKQLISLSTQYSKLSSQLDIAKQKLQEQTEARKSLFDSTKNSLSGLPDLKDAEGNAQTLSGYLEALQKQASENYTLNVMLQRLKMNGLNDTSYLDFLGKGTDAIPFLTNLLAGGKDAIKQVNDLVSKVGKTATDAAFNAGNNMYGEGQAATQKLIDGLESKLAAIDASMARIADKMINGIKREMGLAAPALKPVADEIPKAIIKAIEDSIPAVKKSTAKIPKAIIDQIQKDMDIHSPSRVAYGLMSYFGQGIVLGLQDSVAPAASAATNVSKGIVLAMSTALSNIDGVDWTPTITPVLDLTSVTAEASKLTTLLNTTPLAVDASYSSAKAVSAGYDENQQITAENQDAAATAQTVYNYEQYNYSPKEINAADLYRQTKNQLSTVGGEQK